MARRAVPRRAVPRRAMPKVAVACQGGGMHVAFTVGVLTEILRDVDTRNRFDLVGLSGTSAGALCALMVWYGLVPKMQGPGSVPAAITQVNLGRLRCPNRCRDFAEFIYVRGIGGRRDRGTATWNKCASIWRQSVSRCLQDACCLPPEPWRTQAVF